MISAAKDSGRYHNFLLFGKLLYKSFGNESVAAVGAMRAVVLKPYRRK